MSFIIREATEDDAKRIQAIAQQSWSTTYEGIIPEDVQQIFISRAYSDESIERRITRTLLLVAEQAGEIVAFANFTPVKEDGKVELIAIYILEDYQRFGLGSALLNEGISRLEGVKEIYLDVNSNNSVGKSFYISRGFEVIEQYEDEMFGFREQLTKMRLIV